MSVHNKLYVNQELFVNRVDGTDFTKAGWEYLGTVDQPIAKANDVEFKSLTVANGSFTTKIQTGAAESYTLTLPPENGTDGQVLITSSTGNLSWFSLPNQPLNMDSDVTFNSLILDGDLTVKGDTTIINTQELTIEDNIITLNKGEGVSGLPGGVAGIEIDLDGTNKRLLWEQIGNKWTVGNKNGFFGIDRYRLAEIADVETSQGFIPGYDASGRLSKSDGLDSVVVQQLQNIETTPITNVKWTYLSNMDQYVSKTSNVTFSSLNIEDSIITLNKGYSGSSFVGSAGIEINLDLSTNKRFLWESYDNIWTVGDMDAPLGGGKYRLAEFADITLPVGAIPGYDSNGRLSKFEGLIPAVVNQLKNIDDVPITKTEWTYLSNMNQPVSETSNVTFNNITADGTIAESVSAEITIADTPYEIQKAITICNTTQGQFTVKLPDNDISAGKTYTIVLISAGNTLTINCATDNDTIEGEGSIDLDVQYQHIKLCSLGNGTWIIV